MVVKSEFLDLHSTESCQYELHRNFMAMKTESWGIHGTATGLYELRSTPIRWCKLSFGIFTALTQAFTSSTGSARQLKWLNMIFPSLKSHSRPLHIHHGGENRHPCASHDIYSGEN